MGGRRKKLSGRRNLHHASQIQNNDTVAQILDDIQIVRNEEQGQT
jgi:hypothetical protein